MFRLFIEKRVKRDLKQISRTMQLDILQSIKKLATNPYPSQSKKLSGYENVYRLRVGRYRVIYSVESEIRIVLVQKIRHRKEAYR